MPMVYAAFLFIILSTVAFFNYHAILSDTLSKGLFYFSVLVGAGVAWMHGRQEKEVRYPRAAWLMLMGGLAVSIIMASLYHTQTLKASFITTLPVLFSYSTLVIFLRMDIPVERIMKTYIVLAFLSGAVYFCNVMTMPNNIFGKPIINIDDSRGIVRVSVTFIEMLPIVIFYAINRWMADRKAGWIFLSAFVLVLVVLSVTRQVIFFTLLLSVLFILRRVSWKVKAIVCAVCLGVVVFVLPMIPVYNSMIELSEEQVDENEEEENIRITSWRYYTYDNQTGTLTPIFGNGMPAYGNSIWGIAFDAETEENGCFSADVGWAGLYWHHGIFAIVGLLWLMGAALRRKKPDSMQFINYGIVFFFLLCFASGPNLYYFQIVSMMLLLSMAFACAPEGAKDASLPASKPRSGLLPRFPQLH